METYTYAHLPPHLSVLHLALFINVSNAAELRARLVKAATTPGPEGDDEREAVNFAFVDARLLTSTLLIKTAAYHAVLAECQGALRTKSIHSEILFGLNPSNNITEAIRRYGVSDSTNALLVVRVCSPELQDVEAKMRAVVPGELTPLSQLTSLTDWSAVKNYHKLNTESAIKEAAGDAAKERKVIDNILVSSVAMKSVMA